MKRILVTALLASSALAAANGGPEAVPLFFVENHGQAPPDVRFTAQGSGLSASFLSGEVLLRVAGKPVRIRAVGANPAPVVEALARLEAQANFLIGSPGQWRTGVPLYGAVAYRGLYPGVDMIYGGDGRDLKSEFIVAPGADPSIIRIRYLGADALRIDPDGSLVVPVGGREMHEQPPVLYQDRNGERTFVNGHFALEAGDTVSFRVGRYDRSLPLTIDPTLTYSTLLGGSGSDAATALAVDSTGAVYLTGYTASRDLTTANPEQNFNGGGNDVFVAKLNPSGSGLVYCTYLGGSGDDRAFGIAVDSAGNVFVTGSATSSNFPARNALQARLAGSRNAFVAKLNPAGNTLLFSTYLGGIGSDVANAIALDAAGNPYIVGDTTSLNFPTTGMQKTYHGSQDAFVAKLAADGSSLIYSTYLGGSSNDHAAALAVDAAGDVYVAGSTYSTDFPTAGAYQQTLRGGQDAFVAKLAPDGKSLLFSTYLGGSGGQLGSPEIAQGIALDGQGNAYLAGVTGSADFPTLHPLQPSLSGSLDAFAAKFTSSGTLVYSTCLGGSGIDVGNAIAVDTAGTAYVVGYTISNDLPMTGGALQNAPGGDYDAFVARISAAGNSLLYLSYLGGNGSDTATAVHVDPAGAVYVAGWTLSTNFPVAQAFQSANAGNYGAFLARMTFNSPPVNGGVSPSSGSGLTQTFSLQFSDLNGAAGIVTASVLFQSSASTVNACAVTYNQAANTLVLLTDSGGIPAGTITPGSGSQQNSQCVLNGAGSSVSAAGNVLTVNLAITFQTAFAGSTNIYMQASNAFGTNTWQQAGSWTVPSTPLAVVSVTPATGAGNSQTFTFSYSDAKGYTAISSSQIVISSVLSVANDCYIYFSRSANTLYLTNNAGTAWQGPITMGQNATLQNSQCMVNGSGSSQSGSGNNLTLNVAVSFQAAFAGNKNVYVEAYDGSTDTGWVQKATWTVTAAALAIVSVTPNTGAGNSQAFSFLFADARGYTAISSSQIIINKSLTGTAACYVFFARSANALYLTNDAGTAWQGPVTIGQNATLQNSQCLLSAAGSSQSGSGNNLTLTVALTFQAAFKSSTRNIYGELYDGVSDTGWVQLGSWIIP